jgi:hypothetical protein
MPKSREFPGLKTQFIKIRTDGKDASCKMQIMAPIQTWYKLMIFLDNESFFLRRKASEACEITSLNTI